MRRRRQPADVLTGLATHADLVRAGDAVCREIVGAGQQVVLMVLDLVSFRELNLAFGYEAGDDVLSWFARRLRRVEPAPHLVARLGGDEFALVLAGPSSAGNGPARPGQADPALAALGRAVVAQLDGRLRLRGTDIEVEAVAGLAAAPTGGRISELLSRAAAALAEARRTGERAAVSTTEVDRVRPGEFALHAQLRRAISGNELEMHYQPMRAVLTGRTVAVEALVRWRHPARGLLLPGSFLPMAERTSLITDLTLWTLDETLRQCGRWRAEGIEVTVSANLSPRMLVLDELPRLVADRLDAHDVPPGVLTLEITENALIPHLAQACAMLGQLRSAGVGLSMDDFGTGFNTMEILKVLTLDEIKIDRGFVADARASLPDLAIVRSVVDLGHRLGLRVVGEGVEDERSERMLTEIGCDLLQGNSLAPAMPARDVTPLLTRAPSPREPRGDGAPAAADRAASASAGSRRPTPDRSDPVPEPDPASGRFDPGAPAAATPADEHTRLAVLRRYRVLDTCPEPEFDELTALAAQTTHCGEARLVFVDGDREWCKARYGGPSSVDGTGQPGAATHTVSSGQFLHVPDATRDPRLTHLARAGTVDPVRCIAAAPLRTPGGQVLGALCVADPLPRRLTDAQRQGLHSLAGHAMRLLEARQERLMTREISGALHTLDGFWHPGDLPAAADMTATVVRSLTGADAVAVMLAPIPGSTVFRAAGFSVAPDVEPVTEIGIRANLDDEAALRALPRLRAPTFIPDVARTPLIPAGRALQLNIRSALVVPLSGGGEFFGMIAVRWTSPMEYLGPQVLQAVTLFAMPACHTLHRLQASRHQPAEPGAAP
ncbi:EAL domain-containing protein [Frankia sp. AgB32]|uniref:EAL domain-containing protein n=1 Tax=Frankia sp. AgB32 TaxID=631119 RepID=UPI00200E79C9|nr:EAL domain-containing protein [Frankia sp. AgB32]MCK9896545.1 EAL domain-containing protein [Frankia sp. AgB32]